MASRISPYVDNTGLVFAYDLANIKRSYLGEPTTNLAIAPLDITNGYSSAAGITRTAGTELNFTGQNNAGLISRSGGGGWTAYTGGVSGAGNGVRFTTTWYLKAGSATTVFVGWGGSHTGNRTNFLVDLITGAVSSVTLASGEFYKVEQAPNGFYRIMYSSTLTASTYFPEITPGASNGTLIFGGIQIEQNSHATPFTAGTRSVTQGLKDLTGRSTIDLANVSFDSNAQMTFDGTDDIIQISAASWNILQTFTLEAVFKPTGTAGSGYHVMFQKEGGYSGGAVYGLRAENQGNGGISAMICYDNQAANVKTLTSGVPTVNGQTYHVVSTFDSLYSWKIYVNGELKSSSTLTALPYQNSSDIFIGRGDSRTMNGYLPISKIYNRALLASEIQQNFNAIKGRYGL